MSPSTARRIGVCLGVTALALGLRLPRLDVFLTADESRWACRSANFWHALEAGRLEETYQKEHPGVVTMWLGGLGLPRDAASDWARACHDIPASKLVEEAPPGAVATVVERLFAGRARVALFTGLGVGAATWLAAGLLGLVPAAVGGVLLASDPFLVAHGRVLHLDGVTSTLMLLSLLALLGWLHGGRRARALLCAGALGGLAAVNKSPALFVAPMAGLLIGVDGLWRRRAAWTAALGRAADGPRRADGRALAAETVRLAIDVARPLALFGLAAAAAYVAAWPAMWGHPLATLGRVLGGAQEYADLGHEGGNYFMGRPVADPGPWFYPVAWLFRATPLATVGLALALAGLATGRGAARRVTGRPVVLALLAYAALFGLGMTFGAKKFDRYILPAVPALDLVAGWGLWALVLVAIEPPGAARHGGRASARAVAPALALAAALVVGALATRAHAPYYLEAYNPLVGGLRAAPGVLLTGWGEGLDRAADWLNARPEGATLEVATRYRSAFGPLFHGRALEMNKIDPATVDYYLFYINQVQRDLDPELLAHYRPGPYAPGAAGYASDHPAATAAARPGPAPTPAHLVRLGGLDYAWLYESDSWRAAADFVEAHAGPRDAVLVRGDSRYARMTASSGRPLLTLDPDADADAAAELLGDALARHEGLWWVRYADLIPRPGLARVDALLATRALRLDHFEGPEIAATRYVPDPDAPAGPLDARPALAATDARFGAALRLAGIGFSSVPAVWGRGLGVTLDWAADAAPGANLTAFLHLIGPDGRRWAQTDRAVGDADLVPTGRWPAGKRALDDRVLVLPVGAPPGDYTLLVGVYDAATGERLPARAADGSPLAEDALPVPVAVGRSPLGPDEAARALGHAPLGELDDVRLLGVEPEGPVDAGTPVTVAVIWAVTAVPEGNHRVDVRLRDALGRLAGLAEVDTVYGIPEAEWQVGDVLRMHYDLLLDPRAAAGEGSIAFVDAAGHEVTAPFRIDGPLRRDTLPAEAGRPTDWGFGDVAALRAVDLAAEAAPGTALPLTLWWEARGEPATAYTVFVHLVGPDGAIAAQSDGPPAGGARPTTGWLAHEFVADARFLELGADLPPGDYRLHVGLYDPATGLRLPARDAAGAGAPDDRAPVATVRLR